MTTGVLAAGTSPQTRPATTAGTLWPRCQWGGCAGPVATADKAAGEAMRTAARPARTAAAGRVVAAAGEATVRATRGALSRTRLRDGCGATAVDEAARR